MCDKELILCTLGTSVSTALPALDRVVNASVQVLAELSPSVQKGILGFRHTAPLQPPPSQQQQQQQQQPPPPPPPPPSLFL